MKKTIIFIAAILMLFGISSCSKVDYILPIDITNDSIIEEDTNSYYIYNGDTIVFYQVMKSRRGCGNPGMPSKTECYSFWEGNDMKLGIAYVKASQNNGDTVHTGSYSIVECWVNGQHLLLDDFDCSIYQHNNVYDIRLSGTTAMGDSVKMHYRGALIDINEENGEGSLFIGNHVYMPSINQFTLNMDENGNYYYLLCNPSDSLTFWQARVEIRPILNNGKYEISDSDIEVIIWTGSDRSEHFGYYPFGPLQPHPLTHGSIQFSEHDGAYSILCQGICDLGDVLFNFDGSCTNTESFPYTIGFDYH